jgi:F-type H+-transporting ATPase subunit b
VAACALGFLLATSEVLAAENASNWRSTYDLVLMWVNFGIIVFIIVKYARRPLVNFLKEQKEAVDVEIDEIEEEKEKSQAEIRAANHKLDESKTRLKKLQERILLEGERRKKEIIADARAESRIMLQEAQRRIDDQIYQAKKAIQAELVDMAISMASKKLPAEITNADNQRFVDEYLTGIRSK